MAEAICEGNVWKFGDKINTDLMMPGALVLVQSLDAQEAAQYAMHANRPGWASQVQPGDILVAGVNFACGSSRNWAGPIKALGISVVLAESIARIGLRNGINTGLPCLVCPGISQFTEEGERLRVDITTGEVRNFTTGTAIQAQAWPRESPPFQIMMAGGFDNYFRQRLVEAGKIKPQPSV